MKKLVLILAVVFSLGFASTTLFSSCEVDSSSAADSTVDTVNVDSVVVDTLAVDSI